MLSVYVQWQCAFSWGRRDDAEDFENTGIRNRIKHLELLQSWWCSEQTGKRFRKKNTNGINETYGVRNTRLYYCKLLLRKCFCFQTTIYSPSPREGTKQVLLTQQRTQALPIHLGGGKVWPKVLDGKQWPWPSIAWPLDRRLCVCVCVCVCVCGLRVVFGGDVLSSSQSNLAATPRGHSANEPVGGLRQRGSATGGGEVFATAP